jgi:hypothetical protein
MSRVLRRLNNELGTDNFIIDEREEGVPVRIIYLYRNTSIRIHLGAAYPFHRPKSIEHWTHSKYERLPSYYGEYTGQKACPYCEIMDNWAPGSRLDGTIERFIKLDKSISNCVKVNVLFRNVLCLPEDLIPLILSYLEGLDGLSFPFRSCIV